MKKVIFIAILTICISSVYFQGSEVNVALGIKKGYENYLNKDLSLSSGEYLQKSSNNFMGSLCLAVTAVGTFYGGTLIDDDMKVLRYSVYGIGGVMSVISVYCGIRGIVYLNKAGKKLNIENKDIVYIEPASAGLGFKITF